MINETAERGGRVIIPAFAIGRVEELLYWIKRLEDEKRIPVLPVFVDSPMAIAALARYTERLNELDPEMQPEDARRQGAARAGRPQRVAGPPACAGQPGTPDVRVLHGTVPHHRFSGRNRRS